MPKPWYCWTGTDLILELHVQPRASRNELAGTFGERLKVRLKAPPVDGKANQQLIALVAKLCAVSKAQVQLLSGHNGRDKRVLVRNPATLPAGVQRPKM